MDEAVARSQGVDKGLFPLIYYFRNPIGVVLSRRDAGLDDHEAIICSVRLYLLAGL